MMRVMGAALLALGGGYMGFRASEELSHRAAVLDDLTASLALLEQNLSLGGYGLCECFRTLANRGGGEVRNFFSSCAEGMGALEKTPFPALWSGLCGELPIGAEGQHILCRLGEVLGRCEAERQVRALRSAGEALSRLSGELREQYRCQGKVFQAVGVSAGAFLAILLL